MTTLARRVGNYSSPGSLVVRLRRKRIAPLLDMIAAIAREKGDCTILDIGGVRRYWSIVDPAFLLRNRVSIILANIHDNPLAHPNADDPAGMFSFARADGCALPYADNAFDILHSNSVIEHVGGWSRQVSFAREAQRVGRSYFVQTPNYWFPWEPHFGTPCFQYLPVPWQVWLLRTKGRGFYPRMDSVDAAMRALDACRLLDAARFRELFPGAEIVRERFWGLTKSLIAIRWPAGLR